MLKHDGTTPGLAELLLLPAVRQAPLKKYQLLVVTAPVKSSEKVVCARAPPDTVSATAASAIAT
jgi:hypothetical protein